jgi:hypothetical protein
MKSYSDNIAAPEAVSQQAAITNALVIDSNLKLDRINTLLKAALSVSIVLLAGVSVIIFKLYS